MISVYMYIDACSFSTNLASIASHSSSQHDQSPVLYRERLERESFGRGRGEPQTQDPCDYVAAESPRGKQPAVVHRPHRDTAFQTEQLLSHCQERCPKIITAILIKFSFLSMTVC